MLERYATEHISPVQRIRRWCEFGSTTLSRLAVRPYDPVVFQARLLRATIGSLGVAETRTTPAVAVGTGCSEGDWAGSRHGSLVVTLQRTGKSRLAQIGRQVDLGAGDIVIRDLRRTWELDASSEATLISVKVSAEQLHACLGGIDDYVAVPLRATDRCSGLLAAVIGNVGRLAFECPEVADPTAVSELVFSALRIAYQARVREGAGHNTQHAEVMRYLESRIQDPCLNVAGLAAELGMSIRSFQRLFHQMGTTPRSYILARRLDLAAERLRGHHQCRGARITEIALQCGFNDLGYFSRAFQQRFGITPGEFRKRNRAIV